MIISLILVLAQALAQTSISAGSHCPVCLCFLGVVFRRRVGSVIRWCRVYRTGDGAINLCVPLLRAQTAPVRVLVEAPPLGRQRLL